MMDEFGRRRKRRFKYRPKCPVMTHPQHRFARAARDRTA
jgi:hypothetical protein